MHLLIQTITNNISINNAQGNGYVPVVVGGIHVYGATVGAHNVVFNNMVFGNNNFQTSPTSGNGAAVNTKTGTTASVFTNYRSDKNWALDASYNIQNYAELLGSPSINAGIATGAPTHDVVSATHPQGSAYDIGAYESGSSIAPATLTISPTSVATGGSVAAPWSNFASPTVADWIGVYASGAADTARLSLVYDSSCTQTAGSAAKASGSCSITMPTTAGSYELRLWPNNQTTGRIATSPTITVTEGSGTLHHYEYVFPKAIGAKDVDFLDG